jgi:hypothetical protein
MHFMIDSSAVDVRMNEAISAAMALHPLRMYILARAFGVKYSRVRTVGEMGFRQPSRSHKSVAPRPAKPDAGSGLLASMSSLKVQ